MKFPLFVIFSLVMTHSFAQKSLFDTLKIEPGTKIIGRHPQYDKSKTFEKYNFIIEDSVDIAKFIRSLRLGKEVANSVGNATFQLTVIKNNVEIRAWTINPTLGSAMTHDGHTYEFDINQIANLSKKYPFTYSHEVKAFTSQIDYEKYLAEQKVNPMFIFAYRPKFKYEGSFEIAFPKNSKFPHPQATSDFLTSYIEKIVNEGDYEVRYELNSKNLNNRDQFTMTILGSKKLYEQLKLPNLKNLNWQPTVENAYFFYKQ